MYIPKKRATPPRDDLVDKFDAARMLGVHPETLLAGLREGRIKLEPVPIRLPKQRRQYWFKIEDVRNLASWWKPSQGRRPHQEEQLSLKLTVNDNS